MSSRPGVVLLLGSALLAGACDRAAAPAEQPAATADEVAAPAAPAPRSGSFDRSHAGEPAPTTAFAAPDGEAVRMSDFRGKPLLVNLWATWCAPCVAELPTLDAAAAKLGDGTRVLAISQDLPETAPKVRPFLAGRGFRHLQPYLDPEVGLSTAYAVNLPATILYDGRGREVWRRLGAYEWDTPEALRAIAEAR